MAYKVRGSWAWVSSIMMSYQNSLRISNILESFDELPLTIYDADFWQPTSQTADQQPPPKYEPEDDVILHQGSVKDDDSFAAALLETKTSPEPPVWNTSQDLMNAVFGGDTTVASFDISLNNDVYLNANKETAVNIFPVIL